MIKSKIAFIIGYILIASYAVLASLARDVNSDSSLCTNEIIKFTAPWTSGCFYKAYYYPSENYNDQVKKEAEMLSDFTARGGMAADVHLYRLQLHIKYQSHLRTNFQELHQMYLNYTKASHRKVSVHIEYLQFLQVNQLETLAQDTLNNYCDSYLFLGRDDIVDEIKWRLAQKNITLDLAPCYKVAKGLRN